jgi:hypothetical protein
MTSVEMSFQKIGVRADLVRVPKKGSRRDSLGNLPMRVNVLSDWRGSYFQIERRWNVQLSVPDADASDRHLLLVAQHVGYGDELSSRFLCGHDERAWFVAAIPESAGVMSVQGAKDALKPQEVWDSMRENAVPMDQRDLRWTAAFVRQGEWFFLPRPDMEVDWTEVLFNEPISRGGGKPHVCEMVYRAGGVRVFVSWKYPNGLTNDEYRELDEVERRRQHWQERTRDAEVYASGMVQHPDHATIVLPCWHRVVMNTETKARAMENVAFLD